MGSILIVYIYYQLSSRYSLILSYADRQVSIDIYVHSTQQIYTDNNTIVLVGGVICLVNSVNERDLDLLNS